MTISKNPSAAPQSPKDWVAVQCVTPINQVAEKFGIPPMEDELLWGIDPGSPRGSTSAYDDNPYLTPDEWQATMKAQIPFPASPLASMPKPQSTSTPSSKVFGPLKPPSPVYQEDGIYYEPVTFFVSHEEIFSARNLGTNPDSVMKQLATTLLRNQFGPSAVRLASWRGSDFDMETSAWRCTFLVPEDIVAKARAAAQKKEPQPLAEVPETLTIEVYDTELRGSPGAVTNRMREKLVKLVGEELAGKARLTAESYDGTRRKYVNVYQIAGGKVSATVAKARAKAFDRPGAGKRLIRIKKESTP